MILATKTDVDEARRELADRLEDAAYALTSWQNNPTEPKRYRDADNAITRAKTALDEYEQVLTTWAAGPAAGTEGLPL